jgi:hypothetical protein
MRRVTWRSKVQRKRRHAHAKAPRGQPQNAAAKLQPRRLGELEVRFGVHGMTRIVKAIGEAGLESEFNDAMGLEHQFVKVKRKSLRRIKDFVESKPELSGLAEAIRRCNCPDDDPYCFYI